METSAGTGVRRSHRTSHIGSAVPYGGARGVSASVGASVGAGFGVIASTSVGIGASYCAAPVAGAAAVPASIRKRSRSAERKKVVSSPHLRHKRPHSRSRRKVALRTQHVTKAVFGPGSGAQESSRPQSAQPVKEASSQQQQHITVPLKVVLPPLKGDSHQSKVFTMDQEMCKGSVDTDTNTTDNNIAVIEGGGGGELNVEEFECGVSVSGSDHEKQEWSFTLYDFDGRGKVTKEDLGRLLQSLYQAVGSSISLPDTGTKTMKLRLTVGPDSTKTEDLSKPDGLGSSPAKADAIKVNPDKDNAARNNNKTSVRVMKDSSDSTRQSVLQNNLWRGEQHQLEKPLQHMDIKNNLSRSHSRSPAKVRGVDHKDLAELVQKNMERHQRQQKLRKHSSERLQASESSSPRQPANNRSTTMNVESPERRNYYLDLAGVENQVSEKHNASAPAVAFASHGNSGGSHGNGGGTHRHSGSHEDDSHGRKSSPLAKLRFKPHRHHNCSKSHGRPVTAESHEHRSRSQDRVMAADLEQVTEEFVHALNRTFDTSELPRHLPGGSRSLQHSPVKSPHTQHKTSTPKTTPRTHTRHHRPVSVPVQMCETVSSPHYHRRHKHREKNHDRAMKQVAEWIEREHSLNCNGEHVQVQRHEHHHIHEHHHHHHYHHYQET